ncbi:histone deacetylase family protein [Aquamicrobium zhengzhouense]|uniref:Histone deacetylase family protein n=1 Tax=Aquamicrobium zhengzhouense TaxID=2781738 RepID=A0ABS0SJB9_9HYPH|nr:histone deacetylase family protein [Aquamicrobium zhengzhouense]MBI1622772.1 histone deacetylase family protein [Aquamicrobium zhengzhouense]
MKTVFSPRHAGHSGNVELDTNEIVPAYEKPSRAEFIRARIEAVGLGPIVEPQAHGLETARKVHDPAYLEFLESVYPEWLAAGRSGTAMPYVWPTRALRADVVPTSIEGKIGFYAFDAGATFVAGTWDAVRSSHDSALSAASLVESGEPAAFALCRPPGHHAGSNFAGGYCFINNAAVAAQWFLDQGAKRVSILDVDYHHGNGTQEIFYRRSDVQVVNLHADPLFEYPHFLGHADEGGEGAGEGFNHNLPMARGTDWSGWSKALERGFKLVSDYTPDVLIVSLGVDTFERDPISQFKLVSDDYPKIGREIARLRLPTLFVMEGGYAVEEIGINAVGVLTGFEDR